MKNYTFTAEKKQWEKPTEPKYEFCPPASVTVQAESEAEARVLAEARLREKYLGTGILLGQVKLAGSSAPAVDWNYGYGDDRGSGCEKCRARLRAENTK